jgi:pimeloyl-ACP methyl ester carboxylesterase
MALALSASLLVATCTGSNSARPPYETQLVDAPCPPDVSQAILTEHACSLLVVPEDRSYPAGATVRVFVVRVMPPSAEPAADPLVLLGGADLGEVISYDDVAPAVARVNRELIVVEPRGTARSLPTLTCPEVADVEWDLLSIPMSDPAFEKTFLGAAGACYDRLVGEGIDPSAYNLEEMAADVEDLRRALGIEEWNLMTLGSSSRIALEVMDRYPEHVRSVILDSPEFPGDGGLDRADEATRGAVALLARYCHGDPVCAASFPDVAGALGEAAARLEERPIRVLITLPDGRRADALIDGGLLVRLVRWEMGQSDQPGIVTIPALIYDALKRRFGPTFELEQTHAMCIGYSQSCRVYDGWNDGLVFSELCHDELPFANPVAAAEPGFDQALVDHPFLDLCRAWRVPPGDPPRVIRSNVPTLVLTGQMDPTISQSVLEEAVAELDRGFLVTFALGSNVLSRDCPREIRNAWIEHPLQPPDTSCVDRLPPPSFIAPIPHGGLGTIPPIPEGTYRVKITTSDGLIAGLGDWGWQAAEAFSGVLTLTLVEGMFRLHFRTDRPRQDLVGVYRGDGHEVTFVVDEPFDSAGLSWTVGWQATNHGLVLTGTEMGSREDALFFADPGYLAVIGMWMESHPWHRLDASR